MVRKKQFLVQKYTQVLNAVRPRNSGTTNVCTWQVPWTSFFGKINTWMDSFLFSMNCYKAARGSQHFRGTVLLWKHQNVKFKLQCHRSQFRILGGENTIKCKWQCRTLWQSCHNVMNSRLQSQWTQKVLSVKNDCLSFTRKNGKFLHLFYRSDHRATPYQTPFQCLGATSQ
jgi:hypothetical protein